MVALIRPNNLSESIQSGSGNPGTYRSGSTYSDNQTSQRCHLQLVVDREKTSPSRHHQRRGIGGLVGRRADSESSVSASRGSAVVSTSFGADFAQAGMVAVAAAMAFVVFGFLLSIRLVQGSPDPSLSLSPGSTQTELFQDESGPVRPIGYSNTRIVVAEPGDSMWSIAADLGATENPQTAVQALIEANGGSSVTVGQQIIVPEQLVG